MEVCKNRSWNVFTKLVAIVFAILLLLALLVSTVFTVDYRYNNHRNLTVLLTNPIIVAFVGLAIVISLYFILKKIPDRYINKKTIFTLSLTVLAIQLFIMWSFYFRMDYDIAVVHDSALAMANGSPVDTNYFSVCPNNILLTLLYSVVVRLFSVIGHIEMSYYGIIVMQCVLCAISNLLIYSIVLKVTKHRQTALFAFMLGAVFIGLQPWLSAPYSNATGLIIPIVIVYLYTLTLHSVKLKVCKWMSIGILMVIAYKIKPQTSIVGIAIIIIELVRTLGYRNNLKENLYFGAALFSGLIISILVINTLNAAAMPGLDKTKAKGVSHFLMMGMNADTRGEYSGSDNNFSDSFDNPAQRTMANLSETGRRLEEMGLAGFVEQMHYKLYANYHDGTFFWSNTGIEHSDQIKCQDNPLSRAICSFYYMRNIGEYKNSRLFQTSMTATWFAIVTLCIGSAKLRNNKIVLAMMLSIIGLTIFEQLFEARAIYLFTYLPIYVILASIGCYCVSRKCKEIKDGA